MGGGGGGGPFINRSPEQFAKQVRETEEETAVTAFQPQLGEYLAQLLSSANSRDDKLVQERLGDVKDALSETLETSVDTLFGGSVAKHTYVDGLSDVDSLLILNGTALKGASPEGAIKQIAATLADRLKGAASIRTGRLAVTITYPDGQEVQLLPAFRTNDGLRVPSSRNTGEWSNISPEKFQRALTRRNETCGGKLVPTIKLAKAVLGSLPESQRLSGYHVESLAIDVFRNYSGPRTLSAMLPTFFEKAKDAVLKPIRDRTGQSVHVDAYLGEAQSQQRQSASHLLGRIAKRMRNASAHGSKEQWQALFRSDND